MAVGDKYICSDCGKIYKDDTKIVCLPRYLANSLSVEELKKRAKEGSREVSRLDKIDYDRVMIHKDKPCPACTVAVRTGEKIVCPDCGEVIDKTKVIFVAKSQKEKHKVEIKEERCELCQEAALRPGKWKHLPLLLGKDRSYIRQILGKPDSTGGLPKPKIYLPRPGAPFNPPQNEKPLFIGFTWVYFGENNSEERLWVWFDDETNRIVRTVQYKNIPAGMLVQDALPKGLINKPPNWKAVWSGLFMVAWKIPHGVLEICGVPSVQPYTSLSYFDEEDGVYKQRYQINEEFSKRWLRENICRYEQKSEDSPTATIGSSRTAIVNGWSIMR